MKKKNNWLNDNRGAALVSIMIAVAFISILASSILYMSYSNFQMKVVNYQSKVNFYGTEKDMTEMSTAILNKITTASVPIDGLNSAVGFTGDISSTLAHRYNPSYLAALVYPSVTKDDENPNSVTFTDGDIQITFRTTITDANTSNYFITGSENDKTITLKGFEITHVNIKDGTRHKITTDLVYRVKVSSVTEDPGGIGEFSVLMDSSIAGNPSSGDATRATMYGNVFVGPGTYEYTAGVVDPSKSTALSLSGEAYYTQKGDYMVVFGDIVLDGNSVFNVASGRLTVFGNIIMKGNAAFLCSGELYMPEGYGFYKTDDSTADNILLRADAANYNVIPSTLLPVSTAPTDNTSTIKRLTEEKYNQTIELLGLDDSTVDDGILPQIMVSDMLEKLGSLGDTKDTLGTNPIEYYGVQYGGRLHTADQLNNTDAINRLVFASRDGSITMQDGANLNSTIISLSDINIMNGKNMLLSQLGSDVFNMITATSTSENDKYSDATHKIQFRAPDIGYDQQIKFGDMFLDTANTTVNTLLNYAVNGENGDPIVETVVGYDNWVKE